MTKDAREESLQEFSSRSKKSLSPHLRIVAVEGVDVGVTERVGHNTDSHLAGLRWRHLDVGYLQRLLGLPGHSRLARDRLRVRLKKNL